MELAFAAMEWEDSVTVDDGQILPNETLLDKNHKNNSVFKGTFKGQSVAVKKIAINTATRLEDDLWLKIVELKSDNVVTYYYCAIKDSFRYVSYCNRFTFTILL